MKTLLCVSLLAVSIGGSAPRISNFRHLAIRYPASASDLPNFYRAIQALSANPVINETAVVVA